MTWSKWKKHILKGRPEKERKWLKYGIREARLQLISRWPKRCSRHYQRTKPHKQKRQRIVISKSSYNLSLLSWKAHQSRHTHCIMKYLWKCHLDQVIVSYVVPRRSYAVGDAVWIYGEYFLYVQLRIVIAFNRCTRFEMEYRWLISITQMMNMEYQHFSFA